MTAIARYRQLRPREQWLVVEAVCGLALVPVLIRMRGLSPLTRWLQRSPDVPPMNQWTSSGVALLVESTANRLGCSCLHRSLVAAWCMRRRGLTGTLVLGVRNDGGGFAAHAWVDYAGRAPVAPEGDYNTIAVWHLGATPSSP